MPYSKSWVHLFIFWGLRLLLGLAICTCARIPLPGADKGHIYDLVFVGYSDTGGLIVATPTANLEWRYRDFFLPDRLRPETIALSKSGTKLFGVKEGETPVVYDMTSHPVTRSQHHLPDQSFVLIDGTRVNIFDDRGERVNQIETEQRVLAAGVDSNRSVLAATKDGNLTYWTAPEYSKRDAGGLPCGEIRILPGTNPGHWVAICGPADDDPKHLHSVYSISIESDSARIAPVQTLTLSWRSALIAGNMWLNGDSEDKIKSLMPAIEKLERHLHALIGLANAASSPSSWSITTVAAKAQLYAPALEFTHDEPVYPSKVDIWKGLENDSPPPGLSRLAQGRTWVEWAKQLSWNENRGREDTKTLKDQGLPREFVRDNLLAVWYTADTDREPHKREKHQKECAIYWWVDYSFPGSWVIQYWTFYPFDAGLVNGHFNDTEHLFVEVDKLGGEPVSIFASDHIFINPNNLYSSLEADTGSKREPRPSLPLFALVEGAKHGMAPDINRDGMFTPGIDSNMHTESSQIWGIRDSIGHGDAHLTGYDTSMTVRRLREDTLAPKDWTDLFFSAGVPPDYAGLKPWCETIEIKWRDMPTVWKPAPYTVEGAVAELLKHSDAKPLRPQTHAQSDTRILKAWAYPYRSVRVGAGKDWPDDRPHIYTALALDLVRVTSHIPEIKKAPLPGKIAIEATWSPGGSDVLAYREGLSGRPSRVQRVWQVGATYERTLTSLFGLFVGAHRRFERLEYPVSASNISLPSSRWLPSTWLSAGAMAAIPTPTGSFIVHAGPMANTTGNVQLRLDVSWEPLHWRGRKRFGIN